MGSLLEGFADVIDVRGVATNDGRSYETLLAQSATVQSAVEDSESQQSGRRASNSV